MKAEYPQFVVYADKQKYLVTVGAWETQKCFTFPLAKTRYYLSLMGFSINSHHKSAFDVEYRQSPWVKSRNLTVGDLPAVEFERHVTNPPAGRTRTQYQTIAHFNALPNQFFDFYNELIDITPAEKNGFVLEDRTVLTNPNQSWPHFSTKVAKKCVLSASNIGFPTGFRKVSTISEVFLDDSKKVSPAVDK
jgi:hypothetical protein